MSNVRMLNQFVIPELVGIYRGYIMPSQAKVKLQMKSVLMQLFAEIEKGRLHYYDSLSEVAMIHMSYVLSDLFQLREFNKILRGLIIGRYRWTFLSDMDRRLSGLSLQRDFDRVRREIRFGRLLGAVVIDKLTDTYMSWGSGVNHSR